MSNVALLSNGTFNNYVDKKRWVLGRWSVEGPLGHVTIDSMSNVNFFRGLSGSIIELTIKKCKKQYFFTRIHSTLVDI